MNTPTKTQITEADVLAFFKEAARRLANSTGIEYAVVSYSHTNLGSDYWTTYVDGGSHVSKSTLAGAFDSQVKAMGAFDSQVKAMDKDNRAESLRTAAAKMLAEAERLTA